MGCPLWVKSGQTFVAQNSNLSVVVGDLNRSTQHRGQLAINIDYGLPNARPIGFSDGPRNQLSHNTIFSSALLPLRNHLLIVLDSIFSLSDKVLRRPVELASKSGQTRARSECPLRVGFESHEARAMRRTRSMTEAA